MKFYFLVATIALSSSFAMAQANEVASITCKSKNGVTLEEKIPYVPTPEDGSEAPYAPPSYELTVKGKKYLFTPEELNQDVGKFGVIYIDGKNKDGKSFSAALSHFEQNPEELNLIEEHSGGVLKYKVGVLKRKVLVDCIRE